MDLGLYAYHLNFEVQIMIKLPAATFFVFFLELTHYLAAEKET